MLRASSQSVRYHQLDAARTAAMLLGLFYHASISFMATPVGWAVQDGSTSIVADVFAFVSHAFRMPGLLPPIGLLLAAAD